MMAVASARAGFVGAEQDQSGAGVRLSKQATAKEVGLPVYPGAKAHKDEKDDSGNVQMGIWGGSFGFKLAVMKMESNDAPGKIAEFYKKALGRYGPVLNCSEPSPKASGKDKSGSPTKPEGNENNPYNAGPVFNAVPKAKHHSSGSN